jgi:hypothetical protein
MLLQATCGLAAAYGAPLGGAQLPVAAAACAGALRHLRAPALAAGGGGAVARSLAPLPGAPHAPWARGLAHEAPGAWSPVPPAPAPLLPGGACAGAGAALRDEVLEARAAAVRRVRTARQDAARKEADNEPSYDEAAPAAQLGSACAAHAAGHAPHAAGGAAGHAAPAAAAAAVLPLRVKGIGRKMLLRQVGAGRAGWRPDCHGVAAWAAPPAGQRVRVSGRCDDSTLQRPRQRAPRSMQLNRSIIRRVARRATIGVPM